ncbi:MAG: hypothetical protein N2422_11895 [Rhodobacteraceae bacterium]|nr:hypothetical protein [Paracoccaceae bacterium]
MRLAALTLALAVAALPAVARPPTAEESTKLIRAVDSYLSSISGKDAERLIAAIPPRIVGIFAGAAGVEVDKVNKLLVDQTRAMMKGARFADLAADKSAIDLGDAQLKDGTAVTWALIPVSFVTEVGEKRTRSSLPMLAVSEKNRWYFVRIDGPQQKKLVQIAYPFLNDVVIPDAVTAPEP